MIANTTEKKDLQRLERSVIMLVTLLSGWMSAQGQAVIMNGNYYLTHNEAGTTVNTAATTTFNPATCLWAYASRDYIRTANSSGEAINNNNNYLQYTSLSLGTDWGNWYRGDNNEAIRARVSSGWTNTNYYLRLNGTTWQFSTTNSNNGALYDVTITPQAATSTNPTINGADVLTATGNTTYTASGASYRAAYTNYYFRTANHYFDANGNSFTGTPANATIGSYTWNLTDNAYATVNNSGVVTVTSLPEYDITLTLTVTATATGGTPAAPANTTLTGTKQITIQGTKPSAPTITVNGTNVTLATTAAGSTTIRYTLDGTDPTASTGTVYSGAIDLSGSTTSPVTIKAITVRSGNVSDVTEQSVTLALPEPTITINGETGTASIASSIAGATIYYTTDGSTPTTSSSQYTGTLTGLTIMATVKAIAVKDGWDNSPVVSGTVTIPSGVGGGVVTLFDYEPHSWSYYSDPNCPIRSLSPADVKITYYGDGIMMNNTSDYTAGTSNYVEPGNPNYVGGAKTNVGENENTFIYFKTLERGANTQTAYTFSSGSQSAAASRCPYTTIPNPFQVRPTYGTPPTSGRADWTGWRGFQCWRLKSVTGGAVYSAASGGTALALNAIINAETQIYFAPNSEYGMEVELEAVWAIAYLVYANGNGNWSVPNHAGLGYERNFVVLSSNKDFYFAGGGGNTNGNITDVNRPSTISPYLPNGTSGNNQIGRVRGNNNNVITLQANTKFENVQFTSMSGNTMTAANHSLIIGRGCSGTINYVSGVNGNVTSPSYTIRLESGTINYLSFLRGYSTTDGTATDASGTLGGTPNIKGVLGCDYDRATNSGIADNLIVTNGAYYGYSVSEANGIAYSDKALVVHVKSGKIGNSFTINNSYTADAAQAFYIGIAGQRVRGHRQLFMEGGEVVSIAGGIDATQNQNNNSVTVRMTGGHVRGAVYGGAARSAAYGNRNLIVTGGSITGWVGGGCNGEAYPAGQTSEDTYGGITNGATKVYFGGTATCGGTGSDVNINGSQGGIVFGAGKGVEGNTTSGRMSQGTTVVVADECNIERNVYGGGNFGYAQTSTTVYVSGGTVQGSVFGGSNQNNGPAINIKMIGGLIEGGLYGGSNTTGTISNSVTMQIDGGQVGTPSQHANIHGGGFGQATRVSQNVDLTLGSGCDATDGVTVYGDVYGGSALGYVNGTSATNTYHTYVTLYKGTIYGGLYGGGLGSSTVAANVYGPVQVKVYGGSVRPNDGTGENGSGGVFGCNNVNGTPTGSVTVDLYGTDPAEAGQTFALYAVYGGGNRSHYTGTPVVTIHGCDNNIEYVYGGGNASDVAGTNVTIWGGHIGNAFGGGNGFSTTNNHTNAGAAHYNPGANITTGGTHLTIHGGQVDAAFGGSNQYGRINGGINVTVVEGVESGNDPCSGNAYAACANNVIGELYGGGNQAPAQTSGGSFITPSVTISSCDMEITNLFGGAKAADHGADINLVITKGKFQNVFGGNNLGGTITGNVTLTLNGGTMINAFGGNNQGGSITGTITVTMDSTGTECPLKVENVYGGGNMAAYEPSDNTITSPVVNIVNGTVRNAVFGGGLGSAAGVTANPQVTIGGTGTKHVIVGGRLIDDSDDGEGNVYGGGSQAEVVKTNNDNGNTHVILTGNAHVKGNVYGGGNQADVQGNTNVELR